MTRLHPAVAYAAGLVTAWLMACSAVLALLWVWNAGTGRHPIDQWRRTNKETTT